MTAAALIGLLALALIVIWAIDFGESMARAQQRLDATLDDFEAERPRRHLRVVR